MGGEVSLSDAATARPAKFAAEYLDRLTTLLQSLDPGEIGRFVDILAEARHRDARIFLMGNGGSASTASHMVNDLTLGARGSGKPFRAIGLTDNVALLTALANDFGYDQAFLRPLESLMSPGDVVVAISASGNSPNVVMALEHANANGGVTVALTGFDGGRLRKIAHLCVHVATEHGEYGPVEDIHLVLNHLVTSYLRLHLDD
jgi:D-sedoheptulose 7-phosphate isomerase